MCAWNQKWCPREVQYIENSVNVAKRKVGSLFKFKEKGNVAVKRF